MKYIFAIFCCFASLSLVKVAANLPISPLISDMDEDGIPDKKDACPDTPGTKENKGCPPGVIPPSEALRYDRDNDGILNSDDKCPDAAGTVAKEGCPISLEEIIATEEMRVRPPKLETPKVKTQMGQVNLENEPFAHNPTRDADHDGVKNGIDKCPFTKGDAKNKGCPIFSAAEKEKISAVEKDIQFVPYKTELSEAGKEALETLAAMMSTEYEGSTVRFAVYADEWGGQESNANLSFGRAKSIELFLGEKNIDKMRIQFDYFGDLRPPVGKWDRESRNKVQLELHLK